MEARFGGLAVSEIKRLKTLEDENTPLKRLLADAMLDNTALKEVTPAAKPKAVAHLGESLGMSERRAWATTARSAGTRSTDGHARS
jgi:hypothetical protein